MDNILKLLLNCLLISSDRYLNPKLRLLVSACYHKMCESCIDRLFTLGPEPCPICGKITRKTAFVAQTFEDLGVEKEVAVRRRVAKAYNLTSDDFSDLRSYNDYLEEVEDIAYNLINNIDIPPSIHHYPRLPHLRYPLHCHHHYIHLLQNRPHCNCHCCHRLHPHHPHMHNNGFDSSDNQHY